MQLYDQVKSISCAEQFKSDVTSSQKGSYMYEVSDNCWIQTIKDWAQGNLITDLKNRVTQRWLCDSNNFQSQTLHLFLALKMSVYFIFSSSSDVMDDLWTIVQDYYYLVNKT